MTPTVTTTEMEGLVNPISSTPAGFDAARGASSVSTVAAPTGRPESEPMQARKMMVRLVFLPAYPELPKGSLARLVAAARTNPAVYPSGYRAADGARIAER